MTRRTALWQYLAACTLGAQQDAPLGTLRPEHPRLLWLPADVQHTRDLIRESTTARKCFTDLEREAERLQSVPIAGTRHRVLDRVYTLSLLYRLDGKRSRLERVVKELRAAAALKDWNPSHFVDVADMTQAFAIGYDWLYSELSEEERTLVRTAIVQKGLEPGLAAYANPGSWPNVRTGLNLACNAGLVFGALAVAESEPEKAAAVLKGAFESIPKAMSNYGPDGGWIEGPGYWASATHSAVLILAALDSALGRDFGLGSQPSFSRTGRFRIYSVSPAPPDDVNDEPAMFWLAKHFQQSALSWQQTKLAERAKSADPLNLVWLQRDAKPPQGPQWPLDAVFAGPQYASFRSAWDDPNALFLAARGGTGSFVLDAGGIRWATDRHNTVSINSESQDPKAETRITRREFGTDVSWVEFDLTHTYPARVKNMHRRIGMLNRQAVLVQDTIQADQPVDVLWGMTTDADIALNGNSATLTKGGWTLEAEIQSPRHAVFDVPAPRRFAVRVGEKITDLELSILLTPHRTGQPKPKATAKFAV